MFTWNTPRILENNDYLEYIHWILENNVYLEYIHWILENNVYLEYFQDTGEQGLP